MLKIGFVYCLVFVLSFLLVKKDQNMDLMSFWRHKENCNMAKVPFDCPIDGTTYCCPSNGKLLFNNLVSAEG